MKTRKELANYQGAKNLSRPSPKRYHLPLNSLRFSKWLYRPAYQPRFTPQSILLSYFCSFIGIALLAYLTAYTGYPLIAAPFGATAVLVFAVPDSPLAQPRNVVGGCVIGAVVCVTCVSLFGSAPWVMALAVATAIKLMQLTHTLHPPGGAVALVGVMSNATWDFIVVPVLSGAILMVACTAIFGSLMPDRRYPKHWL
ncbi:MAG: HPP family protein [Thainema sp.]